MTIKYYKERDIMQPFNYSDKKAIHILSSYISEGYLFPDVIHKDNHFVLATPKIVHGYEFVWCKSGSKVKKALFSKKIYIPRHIDTKTCNTKLESILYHGFDVFRIIANRELLIRNPLEFIKNRFSKKFDEHAVDKRLKRFFEFLQSANQEFIEAYNDYPNKPVNWKSLDKVFIDYQSHIFLVSTLFELYHPFELL